VLSLRRCSPRFGWRELIEQEANQFAGAFLLPRQSFPNKVYTTRLDAFVDLKERWKVAIQAMVYRCKDLGIFDEDQVTNLYKQISYRKWRTKEPLDDPNILPLEQPRLLSKAVQLVIDSHRKNPDEICGDISINRRVVESLCNLRPGTLEPKSLREFSPTLK
jgi:Zn-dependent peptidase ImmA (M78 family)